MAHGPKPRGLEVPLWRIRRRVDGDAGGGPDPLSFAPYRSVATIPVAQNGISLEKHFVVQPSPEEDVIINVKATLHLSLVAVLAACTPIPAQQGEKGSPHSSSLTLAAFAKTDIDMVTEIHLQETFGHLRTLMEKLYRRNPREWKKGGQPTLEAAVSRVFERQRDWRFPELAGKRGADSFNLAFQETYQGDRVLAFIVGLSTMITASYNDKTEFFLLDDLDPQKLYNSARNVEVAAWKLGSARDSRGELFLLSNEVEGGARNLSFEREFGKIIAHQDTMARIVAEKTNRSIVHVLQGVATAVFLPI